MILIKDSFCYSDGTSNRAVFEHLNTELVRYSDSYSIFGFHFRSNSKGRKLRMPEEWRKNFSFSSFEIFLTRNTECSKSTKKHRPFGKNRHKADLFIKRSDPVVSIKLFLYLHFSLFPLIRLLSVFFRLKIWRHQMAFILHTTHNTY